MEVRNMKQAIIAAFFVIPLLGASRQSGGDGEATFQQRCVLCHGPDGKAQTDMGKKLEAADLTSSTVQQTSEPELVKIVKKGKGKMPSFDDKLSNDQIKAVVAYVKGLGKH
jgi:mono/diheme cytochrome c family protein